MDIYGAGVANVLVSPNLIQQLFSGKYVIGRGSQKIQELQFLWRHIHIFTHVHHGIIGEVDGKVGIFHTLIIRIFGSCIHRLVAAQYRLGASYKLLGVEGLFNIIISAQLQSQYLVENFTLGGEHDNGNGIFCPYLTAYLITIHSRKHNIQQYQIG